MPEQTGIAVAADFTAGPIVDSLEFWGRQFGPEFGWPEEIRLAPYNQVIQTLFDPAGVFATNRSGINVVLLRRFTEAMPDALRAYRASGGAPLLVVFCESGFSEPGVALPDIDSVYFITPAEIERLYPVHEKSDLHAEHLGDVPYTPLYFSALGTVVARTIHALRMRPKKVIALDCDNTLWQGTCGEDGPENVVLDAPRRYLHDFMRARKERGMLLALASKNNLEDVQETFRLHPEMPLKWNDFIAHRVNWESKGPNLAAIAAQLGLGLDSFLFVDDNPKETGEAQAAVPEVLSLTLPHDESRIPHFLDHVWAFDQLRVTDEDRQRNDAYRLQMERSEIAKTASTLGDFIEQLQVEVHIQPLQQTQAPRVAQLSQRTNQMNTTQVRRTEADVAKLVGSDPVECLTVDVTDRFGSYGLVGAMFLSYREHEVCVDNLILSCRALGRGVEHQMLAHVGHIAKARGRDFVHIAFVEGPRNQPARQFLDSLPATQVAEGGTYRLATGVCAGLRYEPAQSVRSTDENPVSAAPTTSRAFQEYARIARDLSRPQQILNAVDAEKKARYASLHASDPPRTELERRLASIWSDVLHVPAPGREDDFFDLGGHSLVAVQLLSRVKQELQVDLSLDLVYSGKLTVASMAAAVELAQADPDELERLLAEIDNLSEDELRALLESEQA